MERQEKDRSQDFDWALGINRFSLQLLGAWPAAQDEKSKSLRTVLRIPLMILLTICGLLLPQIYALALVIKQLPLVIDNLMSTSPVFTSCVKIFCLWARRTALQPVIESALQDYLRPKSEWEELRMRREAWRGRLITITDYSLLAGCFTGIIILPVLGFDLRVINNITDYGKRHLIMQSYYPYDYSRSPAYELTHLLQLVTATFVTMSVVIPDDYFCVLVLHISAQFEILGLQIESLPTGGGRVAKEKEGDRRSLSYFIERHVHLNRMVTAVEKSFDLIMGAQILTMSLTVCCFGFQLLDILSSTGKKPTFSQILTINGTLITMLLHTLVNCFVSENLESRSSEVLLKIYSCRWYELPCSKIRCLVPMMLTAKTPPQIKAAKILPMSLASYCSIVKSTAGYISMLVAVSGR